MKVLNFGSLNLDLVYQVPHFVRAGETIAGTQLERFCGGKGLNQSIALARAGTEVFHAGNVGTDGDSLIKALQQSGVNTEFVRKLDTVSGHAVIQVTPQGENCILLFAGANYANSREYIDEVLSHFSKGDWLLLQNEINELAYLVEAAYQKGLQIAWNPSPISPQVSEINLDHISLLLLNEIEGAELSGKGTPEDILDELYKQHPSCGIVLTLGKSGARCLWQGNRYTHGIYPVKAVDTTAAGDTFTGYFLTVLLKGDSVSEALSRASAASAIAVSRAGASASIPMYREVDEFLAEHAKVK